MNKQLMDDLEEVGGTLTASNLRGCDEVLIEQPDFSARIALWGGHLVSFIPKSGVDVLFQSSNAGGNGRFDGQHMGVPVCWPWFAGNKSQEDYPSHGLVRYLRWTLAEVSRYKDGDIKIILKLNSDKHPLIEDMWPQAFELSLVFRLGDGFRVDFFAANLSDEAMEISEALHTYFHVGNSEQIRIEGLDGLSYIDKFADNIKDEQEGDVDPCTNIDRVYINPLNKICLFDPVLKRKILVSTKGNSNIVLWNPGMERAKARTDMGDLEYKNFVCIEPANALDNSYQLQPGEIHQLRMEVKIEPIV